MKCEIVFPACLLLLWTLTASVSCDDSEIKVAVVSNGITLSCGSGTIVDSKNKRNLTQPLIYEDANTGEYECSDSDQKIFVKFRTCDNCIELDVPSIMGIVIGNMAATIVIGVAVYLTASQNRIGLVPSHKTSSDRQHILPHDRSRATNDHYQPLKHRQTETYDQLHMKK
ncbi:T-cell surface glycoprotein CD3 gamma chain-like [Etheostoma cragini]|uniref:T-cell surface glycoprotein CD3 gamma chain-like n=1 Tax=Etheostoma cragini TaxID=417921 RepID=UPI00155EA4CB|nr:T-cell surface glycoprotein CD3 gamma chain-like [Etheostoma cragini]XP_034724054.1 T-cell surface glycoprotein CD3 gamma chain-like [Etheostoma cragini]XP_034724055.1 T-cell surface glycoprotein CD3 gamma chain-like [Etheostoma cragini]